MKMLGALVLAFVFAVGLPMAPTLAADCDAVAHSVCAQYGCDRIINVQKQGGKCVVTINIPSPSGQPPRVRTVRVNG